MSTKSEAAKDARPTYEPPDAKWQKTPEAREARLRAAAAEAMDGEITLT